jgi:hypothetical protein
MTPARQLDDDRAHRHQAVLADLDPVSESIQVLASENEPAIHVAGPHRAHAVELHGHRMRDRVADELDHRPRLLEVSPPRTATSEHRHEDRILRMRHREVGRGAEPLADGERLDCALQCAQRTFVLDAQASVLIVERAQQLEACARLCIQRAGETTLCGGQREAPGRADHRRRLLGRHPLTERLERLGDRSPRLLGVRPHLMDPRDS